MSANSKGFFKRQILVARVSGIPVNIDYRWFIVFALSVALIATNVRKHPMQLFAYQLPPTGEVTAWILGVATTLGLFLSVFGHELSHALMGRTEGIEIEEIVLHPFGGLARLRTQPDSPGAEFRIAIAGPAASFIFALIAFAGMMLTAIFGFNFGTAFFFFVGAGNLLLAVFNLFPGYPLDGGRVLRAIIWKRSGSMGVLPTKLKTLPRGSDVFMRPVFWEGVDLIAMSRGGLRKNASNIQTHGAHGNNGRTS